MENVMTEALATEKKHSVVVSFMDIGRVEFEGKFTFYSQQLFIVEEENGKVVYIPTRNMRYCEVETKE